uniref:Estradiol 17-beta-dehydrogenase 12 n=1 Tax=Rhabditophanes sp. KR3021 TaxID=114890 RepID=A0AC35TU41_9BILA
MVLAGLALYLGYGLITYVVYSFVTAIYRTFIVFNSGNTDMHQHCHGAKFALITGASDGIGKAYAQALASKGFDLLLVARNKAKLDAVKAEIEAEHSKVTIKSIVFDFTRGTTEDYQKDLLPQLSTHKIGVLVNNVGLSYEYPELMHAMDGGIDRLRDLVVINTLPTTLLTSYCCEGFVKNGGGIVINIASFAGVSVMPLLSAYSATKKYVNHLNNSLRVEYKDTDIVFQTINPLMVATNMSKIKKPSFFVPSPKSFVKSALASFGKVRTTAGCVSHQLQCEILGLLPEVVLEFVFNKVNGGTRIAALKKRAREAKKE